MTDVPTHAETVEDDAVNATVHEGFETAADAVGHRVADAAQDRVLEVLRQGQPGITAVDGLLPLERAVPLSRAGHGMLAR